jgi:hypothetical protein
MPEALLFGRDPIILSNVFFKPPYSKLSLLLRKPRRSAREVGQDKKACNGNDNSDGSLHFCVSLRYFMDCRIFTSMINIQRLKTKD